MIQIRSIYNIEIFKTFQKFNLRKVFLLSYICAFFLLVIGVLFAFLEKSAYRVYILVSILLPISIHAFYKIIEIENINKNIYLKDTTLQIFTFNEDIIELEQVSKDNTFKETYSYKDIIRIIKYKNYYFLYINRVQALVIKNEDYVFGNEDDLDDLFKMYKGDNFIKKRQHRKKKNVETSK